MLFGALRAVRLRPAHRKAPFPRSHPHTSAAAAPRLLNYFSPGASQPVPRPAHWPTSELGLVPLPTPEPNPFPSPLPFQRLLSTPLPVPLPVPLAVSFLVPFLIPLPSLSRSLSRFLSRSLSRSHPRLGSKRGREAPPGVVAGGPRGGRGCADGGSGERVAAREGREGNSLRTERSAEEMSGCLQGLGVLGLWAALALQSGSDDVCHSQGYCRMLLAANVSARRAAAEWLSAMRERVR